MPPKRRPEPKHVPTPEPESFAVVSSFRVSTAVLARFDRWVLEQNARRRGPKLSRADVLRGLMDWAAEKRPEWERR